MAKAKAAIKSLAKAGNLSPLNLSNDYKELKEARDLQCCHMFPARSSAFLVASAALFPHLPSASFTESIVSAHNREAHEPIEKKNKKETKGNPQFSQFRIQRTRGNRNASPNRRLQLTLNRRLRSRSRSDVGVGLRGHGGGGAAGDRGAGGLARDRGRRRGDIVGIQLGIGRVVGGVGGRRLALGIGVGRGLPRVRRIRFGLAHGLGCRLVSLSGDRRRSVVRRGEGSRRKRKRRRKEK